VPRVFRWPGFEKACTTCVLLPVTGLRIKIWQNAISVRSSRVREVKTHWAYAGIHRRGKCIGTITGSLYCPICLQRTLCTRQRPASFSCCATINAPAVLSSPSRCPAHDHLGQSDITQPETWGKSAHSGPDCSGKSDDPHPPEGHNAASSGSDEHSWS